MHALPALLLAAPPRVRAEFIFTDAPFASCHAATLAETPDGLVAAWFGGPREGHPEVGIWLARRGPDGWSDPVEVATGADLQPPGACFNPVLYQAAGGPLWLYYKIGPPESWRGVARRSEDGGRTWSPPVALGEAIGPVKNKPLALPDGTLLSGSSREQGAWRVHFERSVDGGASWRTVAVPDSPGIEAIQPSLLQHPGGRLQAVGRTRQGRLFSTWSDDGGASWTPLELLEVPNPNSGTDAVTLRDGRHLLVYNPTEVPAGAWGGPRTPLRVALSDDGLVWRRWLDLEDEPGEYSYPAVIARADGRVSIAYTWRRERIRHVVLDPRGQADEAFHVKQTVAAGVPPLEEKRKMRVSSRALAATESPTLALTAKTNALKAAGEDIIGFGAGEPDFDTPEHIKEAARQALAKGLTKYCPTAGTKGLREAVAEKVKRDQGLDYEPSQVCVGVGGKHALHGVFQTLLNPGDAVFLPAPYWVSYVDQIRLAGGVPIVLPTTEATGLKITPGQLADAIGQYPYARAIVLNSPSNPTGATYDEAELGALAEVLRTAPELVIISDEIYEHLIYGGRRHVSIAEQADLRERLIICNGVSKAYSMTGWRCGWSLGPKDFIAAQIRIQSHDSSGTCSITQAAAEAALRGDQSCVETMRQAFEQRLRVMVDGLNAMEGVQCAEPGGAFYAFPNIGAHLAAGETAGAFAERLLEQAKVAVVPGEGFGAPANVRLSYAASMADIEQGLERIKRFVER